MDNIKQLLNIFDTLSVDINNKFIKRRNKDKNSNKLNFKKTLYASILSLNNKGLESVSADLNIEHITDVSKNALVKVRNNEKSFTSIKKMNDELIKHIYDPINNFIKPYNCKI